MNWRPELDRVADERTTASSSAALGPVPGVLPPFRGAPLAQSAMSLPKPSKTNSNSNGFTSYNMNWRPKYEDEEDHEPVPYTNTEASRQSAVSNSRVLPSTSAATNSRSGEQQFRVSLAEDCPIVQCIGTSAFSATQDGLTCTLEKTEGVASIGVVGKWLLHLHPSNAPLTYRQTSQLSTLIYCCLYAALYKSGERSVNLKLTDPSASSTTVRKALSNLGLPEDLSLPITPSFIMQLYQHVEPHLLTPPFPYFSTQSFHGAHQPVAHPARPPPSQGPAETVYTRLAGDGSHSRISRQIVTRGTEQLSVERTSSPSGPLKATSSLEIQLSWALEDASFSSIVEHVQDYDRGEMLLEWNSSQCLTILIFL
jgi:hypothetical protein